MPLALAICAALLNNVLIHGVFSLFPASQTFVLANMIEQGPARNYLQEVCPAAGFKLCATWNTLPATSYEFLWSTDTLQRLGGFEGMHDEATEIVAGTIRTRPTEVLDMMARSIVSSFLVHAPGAELRPLSNDPWMTDVLAKIRAGNSTVLQGEPRGAKFGSAGVPARRRRGDPHGSGPGVAGHGILRVQEPPRRGRVAWPFSSRPPC